MRARIAPSTQYVRGVGALAATDFEQPHRLKVAEDGGKEARFCFVGKQALAELHQDSRVKAFIVEGPMERVLPVQPRLKSVDCGAVGQFFELLEDRHEGQQHGGEGRLALGVVRSEKSASWNWAKRVSPTRR